MLSTTARLVNQDLHSVIAQLSHASQRPTAVVHAHTATCLVCGHVTLGTGGADLTDVTCFNCGHVVHSSCLAESQTGSQCPLCVPRCRCVASRYPSAFPAATAPVAAYSPASGRGQLIDSAHIASVDRLRAMSRSASRLTVLGELAQLDHTRASGGRGGARLRAESSSCSLLQSEQFALRLSAPPPPATTNH